MTLEKPSNKINPKKARNLTLEKFPGIHKDDPN